MIFHLGNLRLYKPGIIKSLLSHTVESQQLCLLVRTVAMAPMAQSCYGVCGRVREYMDEGEPRCLKNVSFYTSSKHG